MATRKNGFLCYAHAGGDSPSRKYVVELQKHLNQIHPEEEHAAWCDQDIEAGADWLPRILCALDQAAYAVLFVNVEFLDSRFIEEIELPRLLDAAQRNGLLLLPLRISDCLLPEWLERIQFLNYEEKPLASMQRPKRDSLYTAVARRVKDHLDSNTSDYTAIKQAATVSGSESTNRGRAADLSATGAISEPFTPEDAQFLADALSQELAQRLNQIRELYRRGERVTASEEIGQLLEHPHWSALNTSLRGRILRTAALYRLVDASDIDGARKLAERALAENPNGDGQVLAAQLAYRTDKVESALELLAEPASSEARQLKAGILIESGRVKEALTLLGEADSAVDPDAGTLRLRALALLVLHRLPEATDAIDRSVALGPDALALRTAAAVVDFWRACTPVALDLTDHPLAPMPFPSALIRADDRAQGALERAAERLSTAIEQIPKGSPEWIHWATWRLICLLAAGESLESAVELTDRILGVDGPVPLWALLWAVHFGVAFNHAEVKNRLCAVTFETDAQPGRHLGRCAAAIRRTRRSERPRTRHLTLAQGYGNRLGSIGLCR